MPKLKRLTLSIVGCALLLGCTETMPSDAAAAMPGAVLSAVSRTDALRRQQILRDSSERDTIHSVSNAFWTDSMLAFRPLDDTSFELTNFVPFGLKSITVTARLDGAPTVLKLLVLDSIGPHERMRLRYPKVTGFPTLDGRTAELGSTFRFAASGISLGYLADSPKLKLIKDIGAHWLIRFHDYSKEQPTHTSWNPIRPAQARLMTALMMNAAYLFSRQEYKERFLKERFYKDVNDTTRVVPDSAWFTPTETKALFDKLMVRTFDMGIVGGGGLGGGSVLGIANGTVTGQFDYKWNDSLLTLTYFPESYYTGPHPLLSHEMGHCLGYGHNSNVCSTGRMGPAGTPEWQRMFGFPALSNLMHSKYLAYGLLPCLKSDYYRQDDFDYRQPAWGSPY